MVRKPAASNNSDARPSTQWPNGRCKRNHDITNPDNVAKRRRPPPRSDEYLQTCRLCNRARRRAERAGQRLARVDAWPPRQCDRDRCGTTYLRTTESVREWEKRRYCSRRCAGLAVAQATNPGAGSHEPLSEDEVARLRRLVGLA